MKKRLLLLFCAASAFCCTIQSQTKEEKKMDKFITQLMKQMTLDEKIGQLDLSTGGDFTTGIGKTKGVPEKVRKGKSGAVFNVIGVDKIREAQRIAVEESRMKIPLLFGFDVIHGYKTGFPIPLALACSWDMKAVEQMAHISAVEASADGLNWTFSPMVDISRDPRWGRISEGAGEDPYLGGEVGKAMVIGYQGEKPYTLPTNILACVKHFALYGAPDGGRDYNTVDMSRHRMFNEYMLPYQVAIEAGAGSVMAAFNEVDGIPATANRFLLTDVLRTKWNFDGFVVTDYTATEEMSSHGIGDLETVSAKALHAGSDMDMVSEGFLKTLRASCKAGKVSEKEINLACRRILEVKYKMGLFDDPYKYCKSGRESDLNNSAHLQAARDIASKTFVLLKNKNNTLPLARNGKVALIGPYSTNKGNLAGSWCGKVDVDKCVSLLDGLKEVTQGQMNISVAKGCNLYGDPILEDRVAKGNKSFDRDNRTEEELLAEALAVAQQSDIIVAALGEGAEMSGEAACRVDIGLPDVQQRLLKELVKTGKPVVLVLFAGRPMTLQWEDDHVDAILNVWLAGSMAGPAIADALVGNVNPSGKTVNSFPRHLGQVPIYYNHKMTGRPEYKDKSHTKYRSNYLDIDNSPLYPFGYGLSYTQFEYSEIEMSRASMNKDEKIEVSVVVKNSGSKTGEEVVQLYIRDLVGSVTRPVKELKGFRKIALKAGESQKVSFTIDNNMLRFYDNDLNFISEPGEFDVMVGGNSRDVKTTRFVLQ